MDKKVKFYRGIVFSLLLSLIPTTVYAHDGSNLPFGGFLSGLIHPVLGYDHFLAMLSVGVLSAQIGGKAIWTVPATFVGVMAVGGALGLIGPGFQFIEFGIAFSLIILGIAIAAERKLAIGIAMTAVGVFATFHGYAHGTEVPQTAEPFLYALGFLTGTALIHILGVIIGDIAKHYESGKLILRGGGAFVSIIGLLFAIGVI